MAQEVLIAGALFSNVPSIKVPDSNSVYHSFVDTSDATATAATILDGYTAYVDGSKITGTATGGGVDGDDLAYGGAFVGTAIVGSAVLTS